MNKKFSTLVASLLLASVVGTVSAADAGTRSAHPGDRPTVIENGKYYQLTNGGSVLVMSQNVDGTYVLKFVNHKDAELSKSLWEIKAVKMNNENGIAFEFYNLSYGLPISYDVATAVKANATAATLLSHKAMNWKWAPGIKGVGIASTYNLEAYFGEKDGAIQNDSIMTLQQTAKGIAAVKYATADEALTSLSVGVREATEVTLTDFDLNTMLQTQKLDMLKLTFTKDVTDPSAGNKFTQQKYKAVAPLKETFSIATVKQLKDEADAKKAASVAAEKALADFREEMAAGNLPLGEANKKLNKLIGEANTLEGEKTTSYTKYTEAWAKYEILKEAEGLALHEVQDLDGVAADVMDKFVIAEAAKKTADDAVNDNALSIQTLEGIKRDAETAKSTAEIRLTTAGNEMTAARTNDAAVKEAVDAIKSDAYKTVNANAAKAKYMATDAYKGLEGTALDLVNNLFVAIETQGTAKCSTEAVKTIVGGFYADVQHVTLVAEDAYGVCFDESEAAEAALTLATQNLTAETAKTAKLVSTQAAKEKAYKSALDALSAADGAAGTALEAYKAAQKAAAGQNEIVTANQNNYTAVSIALAAKELEVAAQQAVFDGLFADRGDMYVKYNELGSNARTAWNQYLQANSMYLEHNGMQDNWYSLQAADNNYLMVDTGYVTEESGRQDLGFRLGNRIEMDSKAAGNIYNARDINGRFNFRFRYFPTADSLVIVTDGFNKKHVTTLYWKNRGANEITTKYASAIPGQEPNVVKVMVLGGGRREVTVGNSENRLGTNTYTINTRIGLGLVYENTDKVLAPGLYNVKIKNAKNVDNDGAYLVYDLDGSLTRVQPDANVKFAHMPSAQWAVEATTAYGASPVAYNREYTTALTQTSYKTLSENTIVTTYLYNGVIAKDTLEFVAIPNDTLGYYNEKVKINQLYKVNYLHMADGYQVSVGNTVIGTDTVLNVVNEFNGANFQLIPVKLDAAYGLKNFADVKNLKRGIYALRVKDGNKLVNNGKYVSVSKVNGTEMMTVTESEAKAARFMLKEVNCVDSVHYYAMIVVDAMGRPMFKAGVNESLGLIKAEDIKSETRTSAFNLAITDTKLYREFTADELGTDGVLKFFRTNSTDKEYLYEDTDSKYSAGKGIPFLGVEGKGDAKDAEMTVISTKVEDTLMPQYLIARGVSSVKGDTTWCNATAGHTHATLADSLACSHTILTMDSIKGRFLINLIDSVPVDKKYTWENTYKRLAFVPGVVTADTLIISSSKKKIALSTVNKHDATKFAFRLINDATNNFLIESESWKNNAFDGNIAPMVKGGWVKIQNGVPVIVNGNWEDALQAETFNVDTNAGGETSNDEISASSISVLANEGAVQIAGAAGKKVVISNILGQMIANTVIASDNATIVVPAGIVVVAVEGEEAVKAIVK